MSIQLFEIPLKGRLTGRSVVVAHTMIQGEQDQILPLIDEVSNRVPPKNGHARFTPAGFALRAVSEKTLARLDDVVADASIDIEVVKMDPVEPSELSRYVGEEVLNAALGAMPKPVAPVAERPAGMNGY